MSRVEDDPDHRQRMFEMRINLPVIVDGRRGWVTSIDVDRNRIGVVLDDDQEIFVNVEEVWIRR